MKTSKNNLLKIFACTLALILCLPFLVFSNNYKVAVAESSELLNQQSFVINSTAGVLRTKNDCLVKKGTNEFYEGYVYSCINSDGNNSDMIFNVSQISFDDEKSFFIWVFIPSLLVQDLVIELSDGANSIKWRLSGTEIDNSNIYNASLEDMIKNYNGKLSKGWKLLELNKSDGTMPQGTSPATINSIKFNYGFLTENISQDDADFAVCYPFVADKTGDRSGVVLHQDYVVYADKESFLKNIFSVYVDDKITLSNAKDFFEYVIIGKQNILNNLSGYVWNVLFTPPSGTSQVLTFDKKIEITFLNAGYYLLDITLTTIDQDYYPIISEAVSIYAEPFSFAYFQKSNFKLTLATNNVLVLTLSPDFELENDTALIIDIGDKNLADATYYIENDKIYITIDAKALGNTNLTVSASGLKTGNVNVQTYEVNAEITIEKAKENPNNTAIWLIFGILMTGFVVYLVILFVKSRRFGVK